MSKPTPGPWVVELIGGKFFGGCVKGPDGLQVALATAPGEAVDDDTRRANATLIAAAPELAEALRNCLALVVLKYGNLDADVNTIVDAARAALKKAGIK